jgi:hypothetical protein
MPTQLKGVCDAFEVTVDAPQRGDRELNVEVVFTPNGPTDRATIELRLYSRRLGWVIRKKDNWDREASVPGTKARLERGETGRLRFTLPLPPFVTSHEGTGLELAAVLVTEGEDGSKLRLQLDMPPVAEDAYLVVRGLPLSEPLQSTGVLGRFRAGRVFAHLEPGRAGTVLVSVRGARGFSSGRVELFAVEYERDEGHYYEWDEPIVTTQAAFVAAGDGELRAELPLPEATAAPASIECSWGAETQGIRWWARFELEDPEGKVTRGKVPLHVGVERADSAAGSA